MLRIDLPFALTSPRIGWRHARLAAVVASVATLTACGGVEIRPSSPLPKPLIVALPAQVGLVIPGEMRNFTHNETRWGVEWNVALGEGHKSLMVEVLKNTFAEVKEFRDIDEARVAPGLKAIFEPRIEQYSFVTARETGGRYYAVTIRYRIDLFAPNGEKVDSLTLTGYGNSLAKGMSSGRPLEQATAAAMRDAAAKFLVQFPEQPVGVRLARNEAVVVEAKSAAADAGGIETVPIEEATVDAGPVIAPTPPAPPSAIPDPVATPVATPPAAQKAS
jgi:hypothetical protein